MAKTFRGNGYLFPRIGEIVGGSQREERLDSSWRRIKALGI